MNRDQKIIAEKQNEIISIITSVWDRKNELSKSFFNSKKSDELWVFRYGKFVQSEDDVFGFREFLFVSISANTEKVKKSFIKAFCKKVLKTSLFSYVVAEILRPIAIIIAKEIRREISVALANAFLRIVKTDFEMFAKIAVSETDKIIEKKKKYVSSKTLLIIGFADADFYLNTISPRLGTLKKIALMASDDSADSAKRLNQLASRIKSDEISELMGEVDQVCNRFAGYKHTKPIIEAKGIKFIFSHIFARTFKKISFDISVIASEDSRYLAEELKLIEALYCVMTNSLEASATKIYVKIMQRGILIANNAPMSELESNACLMRFFSTKSRAGVGLNIAKEILTSFGGDICVENNAFLILLKMESKNDDKYSG